MYKIVVKTRDKTFVKKKGKSKEQLEKLAVKLSVSHPNWTVYVVSENYMV